MTASVRLLSVLPEELPAAIERLQADAKEQKRAMDGAAARARALSRGRARARRAEQTAALPRLSLTPSTPMRTDSKALATPSPRSPGSSSCSCPHRRRRWRSIARSADVSVSAQKLLASLIEQFGGRGGGRPELAQGGGLDGDRREAILDAARTASSMR